MTRRSRLAIGVIAAALVLGGIAGGIWLLMWEGEPALSGTDRSGAQQAAAAAADLPARRAEVLDPQLTDDPAAVPRYPPNTKITMDVATWDVIGESATASAQVMPQNQHVLVYFARVDGRWYITQIVSE